MMRSIVLTLGVVCTALPAAAQTRLSPAEAVRVLQATPSLQNWTGRAVYVPDRPAPRVITTGSSVGDGPFGPFAPPIPDRRLDGSSWLDPQWEMSAYVPPVLVIETRPTPRSRVPHRSRR